MEGATLASNVHVPNVQYAALHPSCAWPDGEAACDGDERAAVRSKRRIVQFAAERPDATYLLTPYRLSKDQAALIGEGERLTIRRKHLRALRRGLPQLLCGSRLDHA